MEKPLIPKGKSVRLISTKFSYSRYGSDGSGVMRRMVGKIWPVAVDSTEDRIYIKSPEDDYKYSFSRQDVVFPEKSKVKPIQPKLFDPAQLDI